MRKPFTTIVVKSVVEGQEKKVRVKDFMNKRKLLGRLRGINISSIVSEDPDRGALGGGGGIIFPPPTPTPTPVDPTVSGIFELNPDLRQLQGSYTDATEVEVVMSSEGSIVFTALTTLSDGSWSLDLGPYTFEPQKGYEATITASNNTGADPVSIVLTDTYAPPILSVDWIVEEPFSLTGTYSNADYINILITDANGLTVSQGQALLEADGPNWEFNVSDLQLLDGMDYTVQATAHNADGDTIVVSQQTYVAPPPQYFDFINDPDLVLFGTDAYVLANGTLSTNWDGEAYPYSYAYVPDLGGNTYDVGDELTITLGRFIHPDENDTFQLLISKYDGGTPRLGYDAATYQKYFFGYFDDASDTSGDSALITGGDAAVKSTWEHYAIKLERATNLLTYYQNGQKVGTKVLTEFPPADSDLSTFVGVKSGANQQAISPFRARWRDIRFYKRLLTDEEVLQVNNELDRS